MPPTRSSKRSEPLSLLAAALLLALGSCRRPEPPDFPTTDRWPAERRQPDGVSVDPLPAGITGARQGDTASPGEIALSPPLPESAALGVLRQLVDGMIREDTPAVLSLFTDRGGFMNPASGSRSILIAAAAFRERFRKLDYTALSGSPVVNEADAEVYRHDDLESPPPGRPARPPEMQPGDLLLRARVITPRVGADRLFGDDITLLLRADRGRYRIQYMAEEFQLP